MSWAKKEKTHFCSDDTVSLLSVGSQTHIYQFMHFFPVVWASETDPWSKIQILGNVSVKQCRIIFSELCWVPSCVGCYETTLKESTTQSGDDGRGSKAKHGCDLLGISWYLALDTWPFCELQNLRSYSKHVHCRSPTSLSWLQRKQQMLDGFIGIKLEALKHLSITAKHMCQWGLTSKAVW